MAMIAPLAFAANFFGLSEACFGEAVLTRRGFFAGDSGPGADGLADGASPSSSNAARSRFAFGGGKRGGLLEGPIAGPSLLFTVDGNCSSFSESCVANGRSD